jgi:hypothetical protein
LLARLRAAAGPDRKLDLEVARVGGWYGIVQEKTGVWRGFAPGEPRRTRRYVPGFTADLDAALALVERVLPGWFVGIQQNYIGNPPRVQPWSVTLDHYQGAVHRQVEGNDAPTAPLAVLIALLSALNAVSPSNTEQET